MDIRVVNQLIKVGNLKKKIIRLLNNSSHGIIQMSYLLLLNLFTCLPMHIGNDTSSSSMRELKGQFLKSAKCRKKR